MRGMEEMHALRCVAGRSHDVFASCGVDQGCPLGALLFALATRDPSDEVLRFARSLDANADLFFYLDDGYLAVSPAHVERIFKFFEDAFKKVGCEVNLGKLKVWARDASIIPEPLRAYHSEEVKVLGRIIDVPGDDSHQGLPVGPAEQTLDKEINRLKSIAGQLVSLVKAGLDRQTALGLLCSHAGPASQYALRCCEISDDAAHEYDVALAQVWTDLLGRQIPADNPWLWLPLRMGGLGATSAKSRAAVAPWAAWCSVIDGVISHMNFDSPEDLLAAVPSINDEINRLHARLVAQGTLASISYASPVRALTFKSSQQLLVSCGHKQRLRALRTTMTNDEAAFRRTASGQGSGAFLEVPRDDRWAMTDLRFSVACFRRLGLDYPMFMTPPTAPPACTNTSLEGRVCGTVCDPQGMHLECCAPGGGLMVRHDNTVRCIGQLAARNVDPRPRLEQIVPELAQPVQGQVGQARLDVIVYDGVSRFLVDVVIVSAYARDSNFRAACARRDGHAARRAAISKRMRYPSADLVPFALETGGRLGVDARAFVNRLASAAEDPAAERQYLYGAISSVLQDGVAQQLLKVTS